jgi:hypothetical protein
MITRKKYIINKPKIVYGFVTSDDYEFTSEREAKLHEAQITPEREVKEYSMYMDTLGEHMTFYYIKEEADLEYLNIKEWSYNGSYKFSGPGWYMVYKNSGGDYDDEYEITPVEPFRKNLETDLQGLKYLTTL